GPALAAPPASRGAAGRQAGVERRLTGVESGAQRVEAWLGARGERGARALAVRGRRVCLARGARGIDLRLACALGTADRGGAWSIDAAPGRVEAPAPAREDELLEETVRAWAAQARRRASSEVASED